MNERLCQLMILESVSALTFVVTTESDFPDETPGDGQCLAVVVFECTLRAAIEEANASADADAIEFLIGAGVAVVSLVAPLPPILESVQAFLAVASKPLVGGALAEPQGLSDILGLLSRQDPVHEQGSTLGAASGILVQVHPSLLPALVFYTQSMAEVAGMDHPFY